MYCYPSSQFYLHRFKDSFYDYLEYQASTWSGHVGQEKQPSVAKIYQTQNKWLTLVFSQSLPGLTWMIRNNFSIIPWIIIFGIKVALFLFLTLFIDQWSNVFRNHNILNRDHTRMQYAQQRHIQNPADI